MKITRDAIINVKKEAKEQEKEKNIRASHNAITNILEPYIVNKELQNKFLNNDYVDAKEFANDIIEIVEDAFRAKGITPHDDDYFNTKFIPIIKNKSEAKSSRWFKEFSYDPDYVDYARKLDIYDFINNICLKVSGFAAPKYEFRGKEDFLTDSANDIDLLMNDLEETLDHLNVYGVDVELKLENTDSGHRILLLSDGLNYEEMFDISDALDRVLGEHGFYESYFDAEDSGRWIAYLFDKE